MDHSMKTQRSSVLANIVQHFHSFLCHPACSNFQIESQLGCCPAHLGWKVSRM